ncbi:MAG: hypothetical protein IBX39_01340 [Candidatus Methanoperedenaceae archaeon]|nr:hypothetical protein [Candidatus Methanoperedenaceae archaeon]
MVKKTEKIKEIKEREDINEARKGISQTGVHKNISTTTSSWWEERKSMRAEYNKPIQETVRSTGKKMRVESEGENNMVKKSEERKDINTEDINTEKKDGFKTCEDSYTAVSKMWEDSYLKLYKPWFESTEELFGKAFELSKDAAPETYKEFYGEWVKTSQNSFGKFYQIPTLESNKETFEKLLVSAEESNKIYSSWIAELDENSRATREVLMCEADPAKYKEVYDMWIKSYGKMLNELLTLPIRQNMKDIFKNITGTPDIYSEAFEQISKIWKDSYAKLYVPYTDSMLKLSLKSAEISRGDASSEAYKEFHTLWMNTYRELYGKLFDTKSMRPSKEILEYFVSSENVNLNLYKSWIATLGKLSQKAEELSRQNADPEAYKELYNLWAKMYGKACDNFFENTPSFSPFKDIMEPVKNATKIYTDTFSNMSNIWVKSYHTSRDAV